MRRSPPHTYGLGRPSDPKQLDLLGHKPPFPPWKACLWEPFCCTQTALGTERPVELVISKRLQESGSPVVDSALPFLMWWCQGRNVRKTALWLRFGDSTLNRDMSVVHIRVRGKAACVVVSHFGKGSYYKYMLRKVQREKHQNVTVSW